MSTNAANTVNNILTVLNVLLKKAVDWAVIERMPCAVTLLPVSKTSMSFYDFDEYERLVSAASAIDATTHLIVLLGGKAGLRCGEMIALEWRDADLGKREICVQRSDWNGQVTSPKGGRLRYVPVTIRQRDFACWISRWPYRILETSWRREGSPKERSMR